MDIFTVEEINLMCVLEEQDRTGMIADIKERNPLNTGQRYGRACRTGSASATETWTVKMYCGRMVSTKT